LPSSFFCFSFPLTSVPKEEDDSDAHCHLFFSSYSTPEQNNDDDRYCLLVVCLFFNMKNTCFNLEAILNKILNVKIHF
jgi:hypothetical protein